MPVALVTGASSGLGRAAAVALARDEFDVGFTWRRARERADEVVREIEQDGGRSAIRQLDLHSAEDAARVVAELADELEGLDAFVNNAGHGSMTPFLDMELSEWRSVIDVDLDRGLRGGPGRGAPDGLAR